MKHLMTVAGLLVSTAAVAQIPTLPWNPDGNGDGLIGSSDLIELLTVYGTAFPVDQPTIGYILDFDLSDTTEYGEPIYRVPDSIDIALFADDDPVLDVYLILDSSERNRLTLQRPGNYFGGNGFLQDSLIRAGNDAARQLRTAFFIQGKWYYK